MPGIQTISAPGARSVEPRDVILTSMPFGLLEQPSIGLGLLKASLDATTCKILYFTLRFAERIDPELYMWICSGSRPLSQFLGEYLFRSAAFPNGDWEDDPSWQGWVGQNVWIPEPDELPARLDDVRGEIDGFLDACVVDVLAHRPKIVGFTSVFQQQLASLALARRLKEAAPDLFIVFGGANCEGVMGREMIRQFEFLDAVVSGEGEVVFPILVDRVLRGGSVEDLAGVSSAADRAETDRDLTAAPRVARMDALPVPDYSDFFAACEGSPLRQRLDLWLPFETSRGCWWGEKKHCTFCGLNGASMTFRSKTGERAFAELSTLVARYPTSRVQVVDNILDMGYFKDFIPALADQGWDTQLFYEVKANLSKEHLRQLEAAGIREIQPGIESLSSHVLAVMGKGVTMLQNVRLLKWCQEIGIHPFWNVLWGFPEETPADYEKMARLIPWLSHLTPPVFAGPLRLDRFSPNFEQSEDRGFVDVRPDGAYRKLYPVDPPALSNLAYYFEFDYGDGRDVSQYTAAASAAIAEWQDQHAKGTFFYFDRGDSLMVWDQRPAAQSKLVILDGLDRWLYIACDDIRSLRQLSRSLEDAPMPSDDLETHLQGLVSRGLMLREGNAFLSLAIRQELDD